MYHRMAFELGDETALRHFQDRDVAAGIHLEEFRRAGLALEDVDLDQVMGNVELRQRQPHFVAIA